MGKIDEFQHAIDHRVAKRDQRVNGTERKTVDDLLKKKVLQEIVLRTKKLLNEAREAIPSHPCRLAIP